MRVGESKMNGFADKFREGNKVLICDSYLSEAVNVHSIGILTHQWRLSVVRL